MDLDVRQLRLLDSLYTTHSVTRTAERLGQTQPTVSIWLRKLRSQLQDPLFVRTSAGMSPTPRAEIVVGKAREILESMRQITDDTPSFDPSTATRTFRICVPDSSHVTLLPKLLLHIRTFAPSVRVDVVPVDKHTARILEAGEADLAIGGFVDDVEAGFYQQALFDQDFVCLVSAAHPRIKGRLTLEAYQKEAHLEVSYGRVNEVIEQELVAQKIKRRTLLSLPGFLGVGTLVAKTDMIATLPRQIGETLAAANGLRLFSCPFRVPSYTVRQYWHARFHQDPGHQWLRGLCSELFSD
jgi:DNA-binding transcriptional LysR family regulator